MGTTTMLVIAIVLAFVNRGQCQSHTYNCSRWMLCMGIALFGVHNLVQFVGHFREQSVCLAWTINTLFFVLIASLLFLSELNLLRAGRQMRCFYGFGVAYVAVVYILFAVGWVTDTLFNDAAPHQSMLMVMSIFHCAGLIWFCTLIERYAKSLPQELTDSELHDRRRALDFTSLSMKVFMIGCILSPWSGAVAFPLFHALYGSFMLFIMFWHVHTFYMLGYDMISLVQLEEDIQDDYEQPSAPTSELQNLRYVSNQIAAWVATRRYLDPSLVRENVLSQMNISRDALHYYLENQEGSPSYRQWISALRVEEAKRIMVEQPNYAVEAVATICGFSNGSALTRAFKAQTGFSPRQWIEQQRKIR